MPMTCVVHTDRDAVAYCRNCGRAMCEECKRDLRGMIYCEDCLVKRVQEPAPASPALATQFTQQGPSPGLALFLGFIPGVGAIYNAQYAKAFLHVVVFGILVSLASSNSVRPFEPLFGFGAAFFVFYMAGEAYHTARKRQMGQVVDEWSGLLGSRFQGTAGALLLIGLGVVFLLDTMQIVPLGEIMRYWPVVLIIAGVLMLYQKLSPPPDRPEREGFPGPP